MRPYVRTVAVICVWLAVAGRCSQPEAHLPERKTPRGWNPGTQDVAVQQTPPIHINPLEDEFSRPQRPEACSCDGWPGPPKGAARHAPAFWQQLAFASVFFTAGMFCGALLGAWLTDIVDLEELQRALSSADISLPIVRDNVDSNGVDAGGIISRADDSGHESALQLGAEELPTEGDSSPPVQESPATEVQHTVAVSSCEVSMLLKTTQEDSTHSSSTMALGGTDFMDTSRDNDDIQSALLPSEVAELRAAAEMVRQMTESLGLRVAELPALEQVHLMHSVLTAWQTRVSRAHGLTQIKLGTEANELRESAVDIAASEARRRAIRDARSQLHHQLATFRSAAADSMAFGLVVWALLGLRWGAQRGIFAPIVLRCGGPPRLWWDWGFWTMFNAGRRALCLLGQSINVLAGLVMLCALPWVMHRAGLLRSDGTTSTLPLTRLVLGLGLGCGVIGRAAVVKLGGGTTNWSLAWACWVTLHLALQWVAARAAARMLKKVDRAYQRRRNPDDDDMRDDVSFASDSLGTLATTMYVLQGLVLPAVLAWSTFYAVDIASLGWTFW